MRHDGRKAQELRKLELQTNVFKYPEGSVVIRLVIQQLFVLQQ